MGGETRRVYRRIFNKGFKLELSVGFPDRYESDGGRRANVVMRTTKEGR